MSNFIGWPAKSWRADLNVRLIHGDALRNKNSLRDDLMDQIREAMARIGDEARFLLVANLPYNIATPIIGNLLHETPPPDAMVVTIQKELADRIVAQPGTKDYESAQRVGANAMSNARSCASCHPKSFGRDRKCNRRSSGLDLIPGGERVLWICSIFTKPFVRCFFIGESSCAAS